MAIKRRTKRKTIHRDFGKWFLSVDSISKHTFFPFFLPLQELTLSVARVKKSCFWWSWCGLEEGGRGAGQSAIIRNGVQYFGLTGKRTL